MSPPDWAAPIAWCGAGLLALAVALAAWSSGMEPQTEARSLSILGAGICAFVGATVLGAAAFGALWAKIKLMEPPAAAASGWLFAITACAALFGPMFGDAGDLAVQFVALAMLPVAAASIALAIRSAVVARRTPHQTL